MIVARVLTPAFKKTLNIIFTMSYIGVYLSIYLLIASTESSFRVQLAHIPKREKSRKTRNRCWIYYHAQRVSYRSWCQRQSDSCHTMPNDIQVQNVIETPDTRPSLTECGLNCIWTSQSQRAQVTLRLCFAFYLNVTLRVQSLLRWFPGFALRISYCA